MAIDSHAPSIERLKAAVAERGLSQRVSAIVGNMARLGQPLGVFDLIWSEGALYNIGLRDALRVAMACCDPAATLPSPMRFGARRTRLRGQGHVRSGLPDHGMAG